MKNLVYLLILLFASPAFAGGSYLDGANSPQDAPVIIPDTPIAEKAPGFKINEALYYESMGSNGYYGGGFYGEEKNQSQVPYYTITSRNGNSGFISSIAVVNGQILPLNFISPFITPFNFGFGLFPGNISVNIGNFSFLSGGFGRGGFSGGGFSGGSFGFGHGGFGGGSFGFGHR